MSVCFAHSYAHTPRLIRVYLKVLKTNYGLSKLESSTRVMTSPQGHHEARFLDGAVVATKRRAKTDRE
jgi:hypothetical protein